MNIIYYNLLVVEFLVSIKKPIVNTFQFLKIKRKSNQAIIKLELVCCCYDENDKKCGSLFLIKDNEQINQYIFENLKDIIMSINN